jgi:hypothetical protein
LIAEPHDTTFKGEAKRNKMNGSLVLIVRYRLSLRKRRQMQMLSPIDKRRITEEKSVDERVGVNHPIL